MSGGIEWDTSLRREVSSSPLEHGPPADKRPGQALVIKVILHARARGTGDPRRDTHVGHVENEPETKIKGRVYNTVLGTRMRGAMSSRRTDVSRPRRTSAGSFLSRLEATGSSNSPGPEESSINTWHQGALTGLDLNDPVWKMLKLNLQCSLFPLPFYHFFTSCLFASIFCRSR